MAEIIEALRNIDKTVSGYDKPCDYMEVALGGSKLDSYSNKPNVILLQFVYMKKHYQEVINLREFGFKSCWSSIGGFVGIFLGYSILNFPETLGILFHWYQRKKASLALKK